MSSPAAWTHADVYVAVALDCVGGLLGVQEFPAMVAGYAEDLRCAPSLPLMLVSRPLPGRSWWQPGFLPRATSVS